MHIWTCWQLTIFLLLLYHSDVIVSISFAFLKATSLSVLLNAGDTAKCRLGLLCTVAIRFWFAFKGKAVASLQCLCLCFTTLGKSIFLYYLFLFIIVYWGYFPPLFFIIAKWKQLLYLLFYISSHVKMK